MLVDQLIALAGLILFIGGLFTILVAEGFCLPAIPKGLRNNVFFACSILGARWVTREPGVSPTDAWIGLINLYIGLSIGAIAVWCIGEALIHGNRCSQDHRTRQRSYVVSSLIVFFLFGLILVLEYL